MTVRGGDRTRRLLAAVLVLTAVTAGCASTTAGRPVPAPTLGHAPNPLAAGALPGLLLSSGEADTAIGAGGLRVLRSGTKTFLDRIADSDCLGLWLIAENAVYAGAGWQALRWQELREDDEDYDHIVYQAVVAFSDALATHDFYAGQVSSWPTCDNRRLNDRDLDMPDIRTGVDWTLGTAAENDGVLTVSSTQAGGHGWGCQRSLGAVNNIVIDVKICADSIKDQGPRIVKQIAEKVSAAE